MDEHRPRAFGEVAYSFFSYAVLVMGSDATEGYLLLGILDGAHENVVSKAAIVSMIVANFDAASCCDAFEFLLGFQGFGAGRGLL
jgi:hypothetical protein